MSQQALAPQEDEGFIIFLGSGPAATNINYTTRYAQMLTRDLAKDTAIDKYFTILGFNILKGTPDQSSIMGGIVMKPWKDRNITTT